MKRFLQLFQKVNGKEVLQQYRHGHVLLYALIMTAFLGFDKKSLEIVRLAVNNRLLKKTKRKYKRFISAYMDGDQSGLVKTLVSEAEGKNTHRVIWVCWLQGMENAPKIVQKCYESLQTYITDREIVLITEQNYREYVQFPDIIQKKIEAGIISRTHMSDLLRLELLKNHGGTWIDATVLCTGTAPSYMLDSELFLFQNLKPGLDGHPTCISNWFITAERNNQIINLTLALLYDYWAKHDKLVDYFIFHDFFQMAIEAYPEEWKKVVPFSNSVPHMLLLRLFDEYDEETWNAIKEQTPFHKLSYKYTEQQAQIEGTYYKKVLGL